MKTAPLHQLTVHITPEAEDAVVQLLERLFKQTPSVYTNEDTKATTATIYTSKPLTWLKQRREQLADGLTDIAACGLAVGSGLVELKRVKREDWSESWKRHFHPLVIGKALLVKPSWSKRRPVRGQVVVELDPGLSFGTGQHPTTSFCLEQVVACHQTGQRQSFLDIGTGSGILAIAAVKLGYAPVKAFDFDPACVRTTKANAEQNQVADALQVTRQDLTKLPLPSAKQYDVVCANLIYDLLLAEKKKISNRVKPDGTLVLAGILKIQFDLVREAYEKLGWQLIAQRSENEWHSGAFKRSNEQE